MDESGLPPIPFAPPHIDEAIIDEVVATLRSGWITSGPRVRRFEEMLTEYGGHKSTLCLSSCTAGLELMLRWFGVGPGDEVIIPAYTYAATANVVEHCGAKVVMADIRPDFCIDPRAIASAITDRTKVIMPVDIGGWPCDYEIIHEIVESYTQRSGFKASTVEQKMLGRPLIISDAAHSLGAWYKGQRSGSMADISVFSFHAVKNLTTAEGGAVCLNLPDPFDCNEIQASLRIKALHGQNKDALAKSQAGVWRYDITEAGYKMNMTDIQAAMGLVELGRYDASVLVRRKEIFELYSSQLSNYSWAIIPPFEQADKTSSFHVFLLRIRGANEAHRDAIIQHMAGKGVATNVHFIPLPMMTYYREKGYTIGDYPQSYENFKNEISLPVFFSLSNKDCTRVIETLAEAAQKVMG